MAMEEKVRGKNPIPYAGCIRVGDYRVWRGKAPAGGGHRVDAVYVADIADQWQVRVLETSSMYATIAEACSSADQDLRDKMLGMIFTNMFRVCTIPSVPLHDGFSILSEMLEYPYLLLSEWKMRRRMSKSLKKAGMGWKARRKFIGEMKEHRKALYRLIENRIAGVIDSYENQMEERLEESKKTSDKLLDQDNVLDDAEKILTEGEPSA